MTAARIHTPAAARQHFLDSTAGSPARGAVEMRSDLAFVDSLITDLESYGLDHAVACSAAATALSSPSLATTRRVEDQTRILQSVVLARPDPASAELQVVVRLSNHGGKPPRIDFVEATAEPFDITERDHLMRLLTCVEDWSREFPIPSPVFANPLPLPEWGWLGDLTWAGLMEVPLDWQDQLSAAGAVYGRRPLVADTAQAASQYKLGERSGFVLAPPAVKWAIDLHIPDDSGCEIEVVGASAITFADLKAEVRGLLYDKAAAANAPIPSSRSLEASEIVYHRKIGNSRAFDRFDQGTTKPCGHGAQSFVSWGGDKAKKGMARRYTNFNADMLVHCKRFPNCNVYGVDAAKGGHKAPTTQTTETDAATSTETGSDPGTSTDPDSDTD